MNHFILNIDNIDDTNLRKSILFPQVNPQLIHISWCILNTAFKIVFSMLGRKDAHKIRKNLKNIKAICSTGRLLISYGGYHLSDDALIKLVNFIDFTLDKKILRIIMARRDKVISREYSMIEDDLINLKNDGVSCLNNLLNKFHNMKIGNKPFLFKEITKSLLRVFKVQGLMMPFTLLNMANIVRGNQLDPHVHKELCIISRKFIKHIRSNIHRFKCTEDTKKMVEENLKSFEREVRIHVHATTSSSCDFTYKGRNTRIIDRWH